ncbi:MAG: hypothetical protein ACKO4A_15870, partial [Gammaproteobacteria bacterium]
MAAGHWPASVSSKLRPEYRRTMPLRLPAPPSRIVLAELAAGGVLLCLLALLVQRILAAPAMFLPAALLVY